MRIHRHIVLARAVTPAAMPIRTARRCVGVFENSRSRNFLRYAVGAAAQFTPQPHIVFDYHAVIYYIIKLIAKLFLLRNKL